MVSKECLKDLWDRYASYADRDGDDLETRIRKYVFMAIHPSALLTCFLVFAVGGAWLLRLTVATFFVYSLMALVHLVVSKTFPMPMLYLHVVLTCIFICMLDINGNAAGANSTWPMFVILLDALLVCRIPRRVGKLVVGFALLWIIVTCVEKGIRFGMYDMPGTRDYASRRKLNDCEHPPCGQVGFAIHGAILTTLIFLLDYYLTRWFADQMIKEKGHVEMAVKAAEHVAAALSAFDLEAAEETLSRTTLPEPLSNAFHDIIGNLKMYRPFLPEALFEELHADRMKARRRTHAPAPVAPPGSTTAEAAVVFTDIQASTSIWELCSDGMRKALKTHNTVIRDQLEAHGGYEVKTIGDAFMVAFDSEVAAVCFACNTQLALYESSWPVELQEHPLGICVPGAWNGLRVRIGVHSGPVDLELNSITGRFDYFGPTVNKAARIEAQAAGGGVAVSEEVLAALRRAGGLPDVLPFAELDMGQRTLKGVPGTSTLTMLVPQVLAGRIPDIDRQIRGEAIVERLRPSSAGGTTVSRSERSASIQMLLLSRFEEVSSATVGRVDLYRPGFEPVIDRVTVVNDDLCKVLQYVERCGGTAVVFVGGALAVGWNVYKRCATHFESSMRWVCMVHRLGRRGVVVGVSSGRVVSGTFGTVSQRFMSSVGGCVSVCQSLTGAAAEFGVFSVYGATQVGTYLEDSRADLKRFIRPLDSWFLSSSPESPVTVFEVSPERLAASIHSDTTLPEVFGWSGAYWAAFNRGDYVAIQKGAAGDTVALKAADRLMCNVMRIVH